MKEIISSAIELAKRSGGFLSDNYGKIKDIRAKEDRNLVTNVDLGAQKIIIDGIKKRFPSHGIIAEEGVNHNPTSHYIWIIDPLDGTHNYIRGVDIFGVSIGVVYKKEFVAGVIFMPCQDELYVAEKGSGSYKNGLRIRVSDKKMLKDCSVCFDSGIRYAPEKLSRILKNLSKEVFNIRMYGSSVRTLSYVAEGKLDAAIEFLDQPWDSAAGACLIKEAGGMIHDLRGRDLTYKTVGYIASNSKVQSKLETLINKYL